MSADFDPFKLSRRADKTGQEMLSQASIFLLMYLSMTGADRLRWKSLLPSQRNVLGITELDLRPLAEHGWVELQKSASDQLMVSITDAGNDLCRNLLAWAMLGGKEAA